MEDIKSQDEQIGKNIKIEAVDEKIRYQRNISVFVNVQCNYFFTKCHEKLTEGLFYFGVYLLMKYQI